MKAGAINAVLRAIGLVARFALSIFMARYMSLEDVGIFALMIGVTGLLPSVVGFGLNYFMCRALVGLPHDQAVDLVRDRLIVTIIAAFGAVAVLAGLVLSGILDLPLPLFVAGAIIVSELVAFDVQMAQQARGHPVSATINLMVRSGAWVWPFVAIAYFFPLMRTMTVLGWFWLGGLAITLAMLVAIYFLDILRTLRTFDLRRKSYLQLVGWRFAPLYGSDLGLAGNVYLDRFYISALAGMEAAGIYFFFVSIASAVYLVCQAGTVQIFGPQLRGLFHEGGWQGLIAGTKSKLWATVLNVSVFSLLAIPAIWFLVHLTGKAELAAGFDITLILLAAFGLKIVSDFYGALFAAVERDRRYVFYNIVMLVAGLACGVTLVIPFGYRGAAVAMLLATAIVLAFKVRSWHSLTRAADQ
jgi:O-antigen/teichoic acid export membrane protein